MTTDDRARVVALTEDEVAQLAAGVEADLDAGWSGADFDGPPLLTRAVIERILAQRAAPDPRIEKVRALEAEFRSNVDWSSGRWDYGNNAAWEQAANALRALLDGDPT